MRIGSVSGILVMCSGTILVFSELSIFSLDALTILAIPDWSRSVKLSVPLVEHFLGLPLSIIKRRGYLVMFKAKT